jgi:predicted Zn-ribbon and HTH transcriptional regulator
MTRRKDLLAILSAQARSLSWIARELGMPRAAVEDDLQHMIRSARAAGHRVVIEPAKCRACGFTFGAEKLSKPGKCPACRATRLYEAQIRVDPQGGCGSPPESLRQFSPADEPICNSRRRSHEKRV